MSNPSIDQQHTIIANALHTMLELPTGKMLLEHLKTHSKPGARFETLIKHLNILKEIADIPFGMEILEDVEDSTKPKKK